MKSLRIWRNVFFLEVSKKRFTRIMTCTLIIALIWTFADLINGRLSFNPLNGLICLALGIISERLLPWGKTSLRNVEKLKEQNVQLLNALKESNTILEDIDKNYTLLKK